ncbi:YkvI family membrane protein [Oceanobacillus sp. CF4.6]|uniref:YkvI family membrane protein n=1 Tax=Oceanobacillus sp. CF4.6 TaxID=3373080 RepID=UPI003EE6A94A
MKRIFQISSAFVGIIVGAGFASGQEVLQYFTSFGTIGIIGAIIATALFAYMGMVMTRIGSRMQATSHQDAIHKMSGKVLGTIIDYIIIFTLFGVGVVMVAGGGSILNQQFGLPIVVGNLLLITLVVLIAMLNLTRVVQVIGSITPFLIFALIILFIFSVATMDNTFATLDPIAKQYDSALPNWIFSAINYVSFNIAVGFSMAIVMGGDEKNEKTAAIGGFLGGLAIGVLIIISHIMIFSKVDIVGAFDMPMLKLADDISPILGVVYTFILFGMIFNTAISMFFSFSARFTEMGTKKFKIFTIITGMVAFALSFVGFTTLVAWFYPLIGNLGLLLIIVLIVASFRMGKIVEKQEKI